MNSDPIIKVISDYLMSREEVIGSWLYGSRAHGAATAKSDFDIALLLDYHLEGFERLEKIEEIRSDLARCLEISDQQVQLLDVAKSQIPIAFEAVRYNCYLKGKNQPDVIQFEQRTFSMFHDYRWRRTHGKD